METKTLVLIAIIVLLLCTLYIYDAKRIPAETEILQVRLEGFKPSILRERQPIVIEERLVDPDELTTTVLKYQYIFKVTRHKPATDTNLRIHRGSYVILYNPEDAKQSVFLLHPRQITGQSRRALAADGGEVLKEEDGDRLKKETTFVEMRLGAKQSVIVPSQWGWWSDGSLVQIYLSDLSHRFLEWFM
jgi:hypothetical protein